MPTRGENRMKKHTFRCNYCGATHKRPYWLLLIYHIFKEKIYINCDVCHHTNAYPMYLRVYHDSTDTKERQLNKSNLWDKRVR